jgi:hypothetical protein
MAIRLSSWKLALDAAGKSPKTISSYLDCAKRLEAYLTTEGLPLEPRRHRAFLIAERERSPSDWARLQAVSRSLLVHPVVGL